ncbi:nucleoside triphosphate pyrophosphohydrolase [Geosporobacter ferrireducens]|uniref:Phosphoribosyl-ATP pyrophosphohydrolase n=1 Tax=Geosporobacter ferrireducens TaxID=1424294 RepID=A0A1D8GLW7_9FIRM|nr:nucleoside triphosphate pyrophosphohydrolase [Geosporobacter ferrireducens]AOT71910.1 phosphoribosyl-ATP pyrophosphohydrolase [Geosporobacter ferrireducens]MTI55701.1 phosphoribosyl-ATP pyrophosphohydrolase [Geosporobacter ferrireducens]
MPIYNKLVRDKIPDIIEAEGKRTVTAVLEKDEYYKALIVKLHEEVQEFTESDSIEEIADILEVIDAILAAKGVTNEQVSMIQERKRTERGGFEKRIMLLEVLK